MWSDQPRSPSPLLYVFFIHSIKALWQTHLPATNRSCVLFLFESPKLLSHFTRGALTPVSTNVISAPRVVNGAEWRAVALSTPSDVMGSIKNAWQSDGGEHSGLPQRL